MHEGPGAVAVGDDPWSDVDDNREPGFLSNFFSEVLAKFSLAVIARLFGPLTAVFEQASQLYKHYQKQGKAPVFLMTVVGLVALVAGFGYGLQYTFIYVFGNEAKVALGFLIGISVVVLGCTIAARKETFQEYGASVIGLGVVFNYLSAYFIGPYFGIVGELVTFVLLALITAVAYFLARHFETRVVAFVTLFGGVLSPVALGDISLVNTGYVVYLLVLVSANLHLARKIRWETLAQLALVLTLGMLEYSNYGTVVGGAAALVLYLIFFNLFAYYWFFDGLALKQRLSRSDLGFLTSNLFYLIYAMLTAEISPVIGAIGLGINAGLFIVLVRVLRVLSSVTAPMFVLITASLIATAIFVVSPLNIMGALWAAEGVALVYVGFAYRHLVIRTEGYAIFLVAMLTLLWQLVTTVNLSMLGEGVWGWVDLAVVGVLFLAGYRLIGFYQDLAEPAETRIAFGFNEAFTFWGAVLLLLSSRFFFDDAVFVLAIVPLAWIFFRSAKHKLLMAPLVGYLLLGAFVYQVTSGMWDMQSRILAHQSWLTWIALIEVVVVCFGLQWYDERTGMTKYRVVSRGLRHVSTMAPTLLLVSTLIALSMMTLEETWFLWLDLAIAFALVLGARPVFNRLVQKEIDGSEVQLNTLEDSLSIVASVLFLYTISIYNLDWMFVASVLPFLLLLYRGVGKGLTLTETMAWLHLLVLGFGISRGFLAVDSFHFSDQNLVTRCAMVSLLGCAWAAQWIYERTGQEGSMLPYAKITRVTAYLVIPLVFLPSINRNMPEFFPAALWLSLTICWLMHKRLDIMPLLIELRVLFGVAMAAVVISSLSALSGEPNGPALISIGVSVVALLVLHRVEKSLVGADGSPYRHLLWWSVHYFAFCLGALTYAINWHLPLVLLVTGSYYVTVCYLNVLRPVSRHTLSTSHALAFFLLAIGPIMSILLWSTSPYISVLSVVILAFMIHGRYLHNRVLGRRFGGATVQYYLFHTVAAVCYLAVANSFFEMWSVATTILLLLHAVVVLFLTTNPRFKTLLKLSLILYAATAIKLLTHDLNDFSALVRVGALMAIGVILMVAAFYYQKITAANDRELAQH